MVQTTAAGARLNPLCLQPLLRRSGPIYCGFDADRTGDQMAAAMIALHPAIKSLRPPAHNWNYVLKAEPQLPLFQVIPALLEKPSLLKEKTSPDVRNRCVNLHQQRESNVSQRYNRQSFHPDVPPIKAKF
jgi:hypothetical protein